MKARPVRNRALQINATTQQIMVKRHVNVALKPSIVLTNKPLYVKIQNGGLTFVENYLAA